MSKSPKKKSNLTQFSQSPTKTSSNQSSSQKEKADDEFRIIIATDIHLGFAEKDPVRGEDSFNSFEEVLQIAKEENADFVLLGGDLFHENKPSPKSLTRCVEILRKHIMGDSDISFEILSDFTTSFSHSEHFKHTNYMDENLNIRLPIFTIHGNHDDPNGKDAFSVLDLLSAAGLLNYFGKQQNMDKIEVSPILLTKNGVKIALYGIGALPEERFHRYIANDRVAFLKPDDKEKFFNIFIVHQNRVRHGTKYLPEHCLTNLPDFVLWAHEHEACDRATYNPQQDFYIFQPGSTVATSLCPGEVPPKQVGLLRIRLDKDGEFELQLTPIKLKTVRQFYLETVSLNDHFSKLGKKNVSVIDVEEFCSKKIEEMIAIAAEEHSGDPRQPNLPLIRLRVDYSDEYLTLSANHFGQRFVGKVANPKELILFKCKRGIVQKVVVDSNLEMIEDMMEDMYENEDTLQSKNCVHIDDVINEYFDHVEPQSKLCLLGEKKLTEAVKEIVEKDAQSAKINMIIDWHINSVKDHFMAKDDLDKILKDRFLIREIMADFKKGIKQKEDAENRNLINYEELSKQYGRKKSAAAPKQPKVTKSTSKGRGKKSAKDDEDDEEEDSPVEISDDDDERVDSPGFQVQVINSSSDEEDSTPAKKATATNSTRGRGKTPAARGAGSRGGRGRGSGRGRGKQNVASDYFTVSK